MELNTIEELIEEIRHGKMVILMDDEDRENEGNLIMAAEKVTAADINFMAMHARGLVCLTLTQERCELLKLPVMAAKNRAINTTNFTVSIEAARGVTTGISAADRAKTILAAVAANVKATDIVQPGHIFPIMAQPGGVLSRAGHTEAGCDLAGLAGCTPAAVIIEIMRDDGAMARRADLEQFAAQHNLKIGTIADLIHYRGTLEKTVTCTSEQEVMTAYGLFTLKIYKDLVRGNQHFVLQKGNISSEQTTLVRVHLADVARDILTIRNPNSKTWTFQSALQRVAAEGQGVVVLLYSPERSQDIVENVERITGIQNANIKISSNAGQRNVGTGAQILRDLGVRKMRLMSTPQKYTAISGFDLQVEEYISAES